MQPLVGQLLSDSMLLPKERMMQFGLDLRSFGIDAPPIEPTAAPLQQR